MKKLVIEIAHEIGDVVYSVLDGAIKGVITGIIVQPENSVMYRVCWDVRHGDMECFACELTDEKNFEPGS